MNLPRLLLALAVLSGALLVGCAKDEATVDPAAANARNAQRNEAGPGVQPGGK